MGPRQTIGIDPLDLNDFLITVEKSFGIQFGPEELTSGLSIRQFCKCIAQKIPLPQEETCTSQQAFYKVRDAIASITNFDEKAIEPDTLLEELFPREKRISQAKALDQKLDVKLNLLQPPGWLTGLLALVLTVSLIGVFFKIKFGIPLIISYLGLWIAQKTTKNLSLHTVGELSEKMIRLNYIKSRRKASVNIHEIEKIVTTLLMDELGLNKEEAKPENILID